MNLAYWCVLIAGVMPVLTILSAKARPGFDNANPRAWLEQQQGSVAGLVLAGVRHGGGLVGLQVLPLLGKEADALAHPASDFLQHARQGELFQVGSQ